MSVAQASWSELAGLPFSETSMPAVLDMRAAKSPDRRFMSDQGGDSMTYAEARDRSLRLAQGFRDLGVKKGDVVALLMGNSCDLVAIMFALGYLGAVGAALNTDYKGEMLAYVVNDLEARFAVVDADYLEAFTKVSTDLRHFGSGTTGTIVVRGASDGEQANGTFEAEWHTFEGLIGSGPLADIVPTSFRDTFMINYTSGSTGPSKGIVFPNGQVIVMAQDFCTIMELGEEDVVYAPLPLFHTLGLILGVMAAAVGGGGVHVDFKFSVSRYWARAKACNATLAHALGTAVVLLHRQPPSFGDKDHKLRKIWTIQDSLIADFEERFGVTTPQLYGQSEVGIVSSIKNWSEAPLGSCGRPSDRFDIRLVDSDDIPVAFGTPGEMTVRPRVPYTVMTEYLGKPDKSLESHRNLWHHSGDIIREDADGNLYFVDRAKDMIRRRSQNISAWDIELVLQKYPGIKAVAAYAVPSELSDEEIKVAVVAASSNVPFDFEDFLTFCRSKLPKMMVPKYIEILEEMPVTPSGKLAKTDLKAAGISGITGNTYDVDQSAYI
jgi:carnitine-CoA ligase